MITLHVADFQVDAVLGHGPLLTRLTGNAFSLNNWNVVAIFFSGDLKAQIAMHRRDGVITGPITNDIELLVVTRLRRSQSKVCSGTAAAHELLGTSRQRLLASPTIV
jgi:hypothetical protein